MRQHVVHLLRDPGPLAEPGLLGPQLPLRLGPLGPVPQGASRSRLAPTYAPAATKLPITNGPVSSRLSRLPESRSAHGSTNDAYAARLSSDQHRVRSRRRIATVNSANSIGGATWTHR